MNILLHLILILLIITFFPWIMFWNLFRLGRFTRVSEKLSSDQRVHKRPKLSNWAWNQEFTPEKLYIPTSLDDLMKILAKAAQKGKKVKPIGSLHSWSGCAAINDGIAIRLDHFNKVLAVDRENMQITAEAGIILKDLYARLDEEKWALSSLPNVNCITLGGAIANVTHGTCIKVGTFCDLVQALKIIVVRNGKPEMLNLRRNTSDPEELRLFEAALTSFGAIGILHSITIQCKPNFNMFVHMQINPYQDVKHKILEVARKSYSVQIAVFAAFPRPMIRFKTQTPVDPVVPLPVKLGGPSQLETIASYIALWAYSPVSSFLQKHTARILSRFAGSPFIYKQQIQSPHTWLTNWRDGELETTIIKFVKATPWINLEYAIPLERILEAIDQLLALAYEYRIKHNYKRFLPIIFRPVAADSLGFMSPTKGRETAYVDITYDISDKNDIRFKFFQDVEKILLGLDGRVSWSRLFLKDKSQVIQAYPEYYKFLDVKNELDPQNMFSNEFSDAVLFQKTLGKIASGGMNYEG